jgi:cell division protein FtsB
MNRSAFTVFALTLALLSLVSLGAEITSATQASTVAVLDSKAADAAKIAALESEVQVFREFTENLLSTVYFSLGTVIVVLFAMVGFGWYQNFRSYERDKEALRQQLESSLNTTLLKRMEEVETTMSDRFAKFDASIAKALSSFQKRVCDVDLHIATEVFRATHSQKTPRTDLMVLLGAVQHAIGRVSPECLNHTLGVICDYFEAGGIIDSRPQWLSLVESIPPESVGYATRIREILSPKA